MNEKTETLIETFFDYFEKILDDAVQNIRVGTDTTLFQRLICSGIIDTLAKCCSSPRDNNYRRFTSFIIIFCEWQDHSKISLPHLAKFLQLVPSPEFEDLRLFTYKKLDNWNPSSIIDICSDPEYSEVFRLWPKDKHLKEPIEKISLDSLKHVSLLWKLRNSVVHEMRSPGYGMDALESNTPVYHQMTHYKDKTDTDPIKTWELVYPIEFFKIIIKNGIKNLKTYCLRNRLNPYDRFNFGTYWIEEFNLNN